MTQDIEKVLPPLPSPDWYGELCCYTTPQMRAYAATAVQQAIQAERERVIDQCIQEWERESRHISILGYKPNAKQVAAVSNTLRKLKEPTHV